MQNHERRAREIEDHVGDIRAIGDHVDDTRVNRYDGEINNALGFEDHLAMFETGSRKHRQKRRW